MFFTKCKSEFNQNELKNIKEKIDSLGTVCEKINISVFGDTNSGKSSTINSILNKIGFMPTSH